MERKRPKGENKRRLAFTLWDRKKDIRILKYIAIATILVASILTIKEKIFQPTSYDDDLLPSEEAVADDAPAETCNVQGIELHGNLVTYIPLANFGADGNLLEDQTASENIIYVIQQAEKDDNIKAIILEIDSYGGGPTAGEEIANALKQAQKPTVALIREGGVSAAYWAATGADLIFASKNSDVGSIAVTMSYLDAARQNQTEGLNYNQLSSGKFKDTGDPDKTLSTEEKNLLMRDIKIIHQNFVEAVAENRQLDLEKVRKLADGSSLLGQMALANGLIDRIGGIFEVKDYLKEKIGAEVEICW